MIYKIHMSRGDDIKIDEEDLAKLKENIAEKLIALKQGIINPSFMISITPTSEKEFVEKPDLIVENGVAKIIGTTKVATLANKMNVRNNLLH